MTDCQSTLVRMPGPGKGDLLWCLLHQFPSLVLHSDITLTLSQGVVAPLQDITPLWHHVLFCVVSCPSLVNTRNWSGTGRDWNLDQQSGSQMPYQSCKKKKKKCWCPECFTTYTVYFQRYYICFWLQTSLLFSENNMDAKNWRFTKPLLICYE